MLLLIVKRLGPMLVALGLFWLTIMSIRTVTQAIADYFWLKPGVIEAAGLTQPPEVLLGSIFQHKALETIDVLPMFGSSELATGHDFNPTRVFESRPTSFTPFIIARGFCQTLVHILNISAQNNIKDRKIVIPLTPDLFANIQGIPNDKFAMNSSPLKVYAEEDYLLKEYLATYKSPDWKSSLKRLFLLPLARLEYASLQIQDALNVKKASTKLDRRMVTKLASPTPIKPVDWEKLKEQAVIQGKAKMTNALNIEDVRYAQDVKPSTKNSQVGVKKLTPSVEYDDLKLMLDLVREKQVKPLFVVLPYNGLYYGDYNGLSLVLRQAYYQKVSQMIHEAGFEYVDLTSHERELYYMQDPWHLGWKGWAELDQILDKFYHDQPISVHGQ